MLLKLRIVPKDMLSITTMPRRSKRLKAHLSSTTNLTVGAANREVLQLLVIYDYTQSETHRYLNVSANLRRAVVRRLDVRLVLDVQWYVCNVDLFSRRTYRAIPAHIIHPKNPPP